MQTRTRDPRHGWPRVPRGPEDWLSLEELAFGRHLVVDIGWVSSRRERAMAAGVAGLPPPPGQIDDGLVMLPAITVAGDDGQMRMFRLPLAYLWPIRRFCLQEGPRNRLPRTRLPCHFVVGDQVTVCLLADPDAQRAARMN
jgi:hypothetical protein